MAIEHRVAQGKVWYYLGKQKCCVDEKIIVDGQDWTFYKCGSYNITYRSPDGQELLKTQHPDVETHISDQAARSVAVWKELNPKHPARLYSLKKTNDSWIVPFIHGEQATDRAIVNKGIDIYNDVGRVITDLFVRGNFLTEYRTGITVCVDVGLAIKLDRGVERAASPVSLAVWHGSVADKLESERAIHMAHLSSMLQKKYVAREHVNVVFALLLFSEYFPKVTNASFLLNNPTIAARLACACQALDYLERHKHTYLKTAKLQELELLLNPYMKGYIPVPEAAAAMQHRVLNTMADIARERAKIRAVAVRNGVVDNLKLPPLVAAPQPAPQPVAQVKTVKSSPERKLCFDQAVPAMALQEPPVSLPALLRARQQLPIAYPTVAPVIVAHSPRAVAQQQQSPDQARAKYLARQLHAEKNAKPLATPALAIVPPGVLARKARLNDLAQRPPFRF